MTPYQTFHRYYFFIFICSFLYLISSSTSFAQVSTQGEDFEFHPSFSVSERYQDNVRQQAYDERQEDFSVLLRPGLDFKYNGEKHQHELEYFSTFTRYSHLHREDTNIHHVALTNKIAPVELFEFSLLTTDDHRWDRRDLRQAERKNNYLETNNFAVNPSLRINVFEHTSIAAFYRFARTSVFNGYREDYLSNTVGGSLNREVLDVFELFGGYRYKEQDFLKDTPDFVDNVYFGGLNWDISSSLRLEGEYAYNLREYDRETALVLDESTDTDTWKVTLRNDVTESTHVDIAYSKSQVVRQIRDTEQILREIASVKFNHVIEELLTIGFGGSYSEEDYEFTDRLDITRNVYLLLSTNISEIISFSAGGGYDNNYFWPIAVREHVYTYRTGITYRPLQWLTGSVEYEHRETDNDLHEGSGVFRKEYLQNSVTVTLAARF